MCLCIIHPYVTIESEYLSVECRGDGMSYGFKLNIIEMMFTCNINSKIEFNVYLLKKLFRI